MISRCFKIVEVCEVSRDIRLKKSAEQNLQQKAVGSTRLGLDADLFVLPLVYVGGRVESCEMDRQTEQFNTAPSAIQTSNSWLSARLSDFRKVTKVPLRIPNIDL